MNERKDMLVAGARVYYYVDHKRRRVWQSMRKLSEYETDRIDGDYYRDLISYGYDKTERPDHE